jgi:hypothetical protein
MRASSFCMFQIPRPFIALLLTVPLLPAGKGFAQSPPPYPNAVADRSIHLKTPMLPPPANTLFADPDFGSPMVRATDETTDYVHPGSYLMTEGSGQQNEWSADTSKFWVAGKGGRLFSFAFDAPTMTISSTVFPQVSLNLCLTRRLAEHNLHSIPRARVTMM